jgi:hypothetical protein
MMADTLNVKQLMALARNAGFSEEQAPTMAAIAMAESSGRASVVNSIGATGLWQINQPVHVKAHPTWTQGWLKDPGNNAKAAKAIYDTQGLRAWTVYTSGAYKKYLPTSSVIQSVYGDLPKWLMSIGESVLGTTEKAGKSVGQVISLPGQVTDFFDAAEAPIRSLMWLFNPASWVRIIAVIAGFILMSAGLLAFSKAVDA